jgi:CubicO group peptidase (beta-lactamase class C family)
MLTFLAANLGHEKSPLASAMASMLSVRRATGVPTLEIALGWHIFSRNGHEIVWHNGGTGGYRSFLGYDPVRHIGVVVLSNTETTLGVDDIGQHLLDTNIPLSKAPRVHKEVAVDPKLFDSYVGRYELAPNFVLTITRDGRRLFVQATSQPKVELFPESTRDFFLKVVDAQITFATDAQGRATSLTLHQNGIDQQSKRIE